MMTKSERHKRTLPFAKYAIEQIERFGLPADPRTFELWYRYATGQNSRLNQAVNDAISSPSGLTEADFDRLCSSYCSSERIGLRLSAAATDLSGEIDQVMGMIGVAAVSSGNYDRQLGDGLISFEETESYEALKPVIEALVMATREMESETLALEIQLEESKTRATRLQSEVDTLSAEILTDPLTLVGNRQYFDESLISLAGSATRDNKALSLLFGDIDHFKNFNDQFGHQVGDQVLRLVASLIRNTLKDAEIVGRYGGEESHLDGGHRDRVHRNRVIGFSIEGIFKNFAELRMSAWRRRPRSTDRRISLARRKAQQRNLLVRKAQFCHQLPN